MYFIERQHLCVSTLTLYSINTGFYNFLLTLNEFWLKYWELNKEKNKFFSVINNIKINKG